MSTTHQDAEEHLPKEARFALVVGVNQSAEVLSVLPPLQAAEKNALSIAQVLQDHCQCERVQPPLASCYEQAVCSPNAFSRTLAMRAEIDERRELDGTVFSLFTPC
ncbi:hypothetical protein KSC_005360 [Ktedonobacter sp. SOSP1-52]|uniref:hypothetical protein n=1 Tax=Ktedonobacter sp. SOSP1-52 TaxID=2778366 RepID=UPI0019164EF2|nr:hypothetical protein [Ktedonobacter sp. SOSP1-52]GHO61644.1 hypothetical protein KSC_005360 [Ktedonobacter sp. SOSP1-52]